MCKLSLVLGKPASYGIVAWIKKRRHCEPPGEANSGEAQRNPESLPNLY